MPYKDPIKRREKEHEYQRAFDPSKLCVHQRERATLVQEAS